MTLPTKNPKLSNFFSLQSRQLAASFEHLNLFLV